LVAFFALRRFVFSSYSFCKINRNNIPIEHRIGALANRKRRRAERKVPTCYVGIARSQPAGEQN
jgi:hypothetical protein